MDRLQGVNYCTGAWSRRAMVAFLAAACLSCGGGGSTSDVTASNGTSSVPLVGTWAVAPWVAGGPGFKNETVRQIVHTSIGGSAVRVRLSNLYGSTAVVIGNVHVALRNTGPNTIASSTRTVTFGGQQSVTLPAGASIASDPVPFEVPALADLAVSLYLPAETPSRTTGHDNSLQDVYVASGNVGADAAFSRFTTNPSGQAYYFLTNVDVQNAQATGAVVAFGASITEGRASSKNANRRWPNYLAGRLSDAGIIAGVLNEGISGNTFFTDGDGEAGLNRFDRDALGQPGVKWIIVSDDAVNNLNTPAPASAEDLIAAFQQLIARAHRVNVKVVCSTLTPFRGTPLWTPAIETTREKVNAFVLGPSSGCDAVLDQARAVSDPGDPASFLPAFNSGDNLHPNDAGMRAIADALDLSRLR
ncbi:GDSL-type esterase/lipase family protein [Paraburkholderia phymatum]|uniref:Lipolytic protein G-D-S-L family n=1 Tax=Paraburkholderia phymatum (strain DSM 17167 / CIP 108236 / LMG 21445 / STM815) TaxID=391038 RepID=B2JTV7_PARP8|nr:GDSL-type esterase/lipase family protein [Paraburkholderia phymatum]ACC76010.1 lipolytic protein G-D-S-L family [Paraburkholderia phymatum STM815]